MRSAFSAALITLALVLAPFAVAADHPHKAPQTPTSGDRHHHDAAAPSHNHPATLDQNSHGYPHEHTILQRLHNLLFGRHHRNGTCTPAHNAPGQTHEHKGHTAEAHFTEHAGTQHSR